MVHRDLDGKVRIFNSAGLGGAILPVPEGKPTVMAVSADGRAPGPGFRKTAKSSSVSSATPRRRPRIRLRKRYRTIGLLQRRKTGGRISEWGAAAPGKSIRPRAAIAGLQEGFDLSDRSLQVFEVLAQRRILGGFAARTSAHCGFGGPMMTADLKLYSRTRPPKRFC